MGFYSRVIFPRLCDWAMSAPEFTELRKNALAEVQGDILECRSVSDAKGTEDAWNDVSGDGGEVN
jgi:hypothetical protein